MNWLKLFRYDFRSGVLRWRYLAAVFLFAMPCVQSWISMRSVNCVGSWMDYMLGCFKGIDPVLNIDSLEFPFQWFLIMGGCLFLNLDYPLNDLTEAGQQVIIRSVSKTSWFLSKCVWNLLSCVGYVLLGTLTALIFSLITGGNAAVVNTPQVCQDALQVYGAKMMTAGQTIAAVVGLPLVTLMALNMLQMVLSLLIKPIFSFLTCLCLLVLSLFISSPYVLGNGAMVLRSGIVLEGGQEAITTLLFCLAVIIFCSMIGILQFNRMDHLRNDG